MSGQRSKLDILNENIQTVKTALAGNRRADHLLPLINGKILRLACGEIGQRQSDPRLWQTAAWMGVVNHLCGVDDSETWTAIAHVYSNYWSGTAPTAEDEQSRRLWFLGLAVTMHGRDQADFLVEAALHAARFEPITLERELDWLTEFISAEVESRRSTMTLETARTRFKRLVDDARVSFYIRNLAQRKLHRLTPAQRQD